MTDLLTESFCERCGTRYTFESLGRRPGPISKLRVVSRGLKQFVTNDDASFSEAMAAARGDEERKASALQLNVFHQTFNFCMNCRQYTCSNCWNHEAGLCLTCAPDVSVEEAPAPLQELSAAPEAQHAAVEAAAWPSADFSRSTMVPDIAETGAAAPLRGARFVVPRRIGGRVERRHHRRSGDRSR